jgi:hypothetical protein
MTELEFNFEEKGNTNTYNREITLKVSPNRDNNFKKTRTINIAYCKKCGFPSLECKCLLNLIKYPEQAPDN